MRKSQNDRRQQAHLESLRHCSVATSMASFVDRGCATNDVVKLQPRDEAPHSAQAPQPQKQERNMPDREWFRARTCANQSQSTSWSQLSRFYAACGSTRHWSHPMHWYLAVLTFVQ